MLAYFIRAQPDGFQTRTAETPAPQIKDDQLLVRVHATSLNRGELTAGQGPADSWRRLGNEAAGEVVAIGKHVSDFQPGDRIMGRCVGGCAELVAMDAHEAMHIPPHLDWTQAAAIPLVFAVAYDMLFWHRPVSHGDTVLITGVPSGVGVASLQLAKALGANVIGTSTQQDKLRKLQDLGLDTPLLVNGPGFASRVLQATNQHGVQLAINVVGGSLFQDCLACLSIGGRLAVVGHVDGVRDSHIDLSSLHAKRLSVHGVSNKFRTPTERAALVHGMKKEVLPLFREDGIVPLIHQVVPAVQAQEAVTTMLANTHLGKIVLRL